MARSASKEDVCKYVRILDLVDQFEINLEPANSSNFNYRCKCPSAEHKSGSERTSSCYIDDVNNNFYCFGCNANSNVVDFYMLCTGKNFINSLNDLRDTISPEDLNNMKSAPIKAKLNNMHILIDISDLFRTTMLSHKEDLMWINRLMQYSDKHLMGLKSEEYEKALILHNSIKAQITKRYSK